MKRQGLNITLKQIRELYIDLLNEALKFPEEDMGKRKFIINITNKEGLSDTWEIEGWRK